ncbi:MAG TPA: peptidoglycan-binding domain-containing protein [Kofleriaceae bacterium]|nr:peptidoglycan-binding domain-containing protein [Kofleriaceae bacterium]
MLVLLVSSMVSCVSDGLEENPTDSDTEGVGTSSMDQASVSEGFVAGSGGVNDDFGDEGPVDSNSRRSSLAAGMWQAILWADGAKESNGTAFDASDIDCDFGPNTTAATRDWQATEGVTVDGSAGPMTLGHADDFLFIESSTSTQSVVRYFGLVHDLFFIRKEGSGSANHAYQAIGTDGKLRVISYGFISSCSSSFFLGSP